ncbi:hypothetical protein cypCar_00026731 [Cyprinus carpio]|nr:hypothetical protein cypCar_00026731 [Cyprinus carpio]
MPMHPVTSTLMYRGICTIPDILSYRAPVNLPEDEVEAVILTGSVIGAYPEEQFVCMSFVIHSGSCNAGLNPEGRRYGGIGVLLSSSEIREAFKVFDRDGNGFISKQELGMAMRSLGYMPNEVELEVIIQRLDMDGDGQVDFEEFVTLLGPKLSAAGMPDKFNGTNFDSVFWKDIENIIMTEENHIENPEDCQVDIDTESPTQQVKQTCVRKSLICAFAIAFIISVMLIAANQVLRSGMK